MPTSEQFWDRIASNYAAKPIRNVAAYEKTMERTRPLSEEGRSSFSNSDADQAPRPLLLSGHVGHIWGQRPVLAPLSASVGQKAKEQGRYQCRFHPW